MFASVTYSFVDFSATIETITLKSLLVFDRAREASRYLDVYFLLASK